MKITLVGILVFVALVVTFFALVGHPPKLHYAYNAAGPDLYRSWFYCWALFVAGAGVACFGDKEYGMFPPTSLRWLFILLGVFMMIVSSAWMHGLTTLSGT